MNEIKIGALTYRLDWDSKPLNSRNMHGEADHHNQIIRVHPETPMERQREVLLHECVHALSCAYVLKLSEDNVIRLGHGLAAMFQDNPALLDWLKRTDD